MMTEQELIELGKWQLVERYDHDDFYTNRYELCDMQIEFTYLKKNDELISSDITFRTTVTRPIWAKMAKMLTDDCS